MKNKSLFTISGIFLFAILLASQLFSAEGSHPEIMLFTETPTVVGAEDQEIIGCFDLEDLQARLHCRLEKTADEIDLEDQKMFMPEECRVVGTAVSAKEEQKACLDKYERFDRCLRVPIGNERIKCARNALSLRELLPLDVVCSAGEETTTCEENYRKKIYKLIVFRFVDANNRAERLYREGKLSIDGVTAFHVSTTNAITTFSTVQSKGEHVDLINQVADQWQVLLATQQESEVAS